MVGLASLLGRQYNVAGQLTSQLQFEASLKYLAAMCVLLAMSTALAEIAPPFKEIKELFQRFLIPQIREIPPWGLALMALGAGVGEEALFRGWLQTWIIQQSALVPGTSPELAVAAGVVVASVVFGAAHSVTPSYFVFATAAGALFGIEYLDLGLPAAAATHTIYDFIAFIAIIKVWGTSNDK
jgi:membrane protease YdiL (CAAX protease family)